MPRATQQKVQLFKWDDSEKQLLYEAIGVAHIQFRSVAEAIKVIFSQFENAGGGLKPTRAELQSQLNKMMAVCKFVKTNRELFRNWPRYKPRFISSPDTPKSAKLPINVNNEPVPTSTATVDGRRAEGTATAEVQSQQDTEHHPQEAVEGDDIVCAPQETAEEEIVYHPQSSQPTVHFDDTLHSPQDTSTEDLNRVLSEFTMRLLQAIRGKGPESFLSLDPEDDIKTTVDRGLRKIGQAFPSLPQIFVVAILTFSNATSEAARLSQVWFKQEDWERHPSNEMNVLLGAHSDSVHAVLQALGAAAIYLWVLMDIDKNFKFDPDESILDRDAFDALRQAQPVIFESIQNRYPGFDVYTAGEDMGVFNTLRQEHPDLFEDFNNVREVYHLENKVKRDLPTYADRFQQRLLDAVRSLCQSKDKRLWSQNEHIANETSSASRLELLEQQWRKPVTEAFLEILELKLAMRKARLLYHFTFPTVRSKFKREFMESAHCRGAAIPKDGRVDLCLRPSVWFKRRQNLKDSFKVMIPARVVIEGVAAELELS